VAAAVVSQWMELCEGGTLGQEPCSWTIGAGIFWKRTDAYGVICWQAGRAPGGSDPQRGHAGCTRCVRASPMQSGGASGGAMRRGTRCHSVVRLGELSIRFCCSGAVSFGGGVRRLVTRSRGRVPSRRCAIYVYALRGDCAASRWQRGRETERPAVSTKTPLDDVTAVT
jgi:hypothetical protein